MWLLVDIMLAAFLFLGYLELNGRLLTLSAIRTGRRTASEKPWIKKPRWLSAQTYPHPFRMPRLGARALAPVPLPVLGADFNCFCYIFIPPGETVWVRGRANCVSFFSIGFYSSDHIGERATAVVPSINSETIRLAADGTYEINIGGEKRGENWIDTGGRMHGLLALRNYGFRDGTVLQFPTVSLRDKTLIPPQTHVAASVIGKESHAQCTRAQWQTRERVLPSVTDATVLLGTIVCSALAVGFSRPTALIGVETNATLVLYHASIVLCALGTLYLMSSFAVSRWSHALADDLARKYAGKSRAEITNREAFVNPDRRFAQEPSNQGYVLFYDCRRGDLRIDGSIPEGRAWALSAHGFPSARTLWGGSFFNQDTIVVDGNRAYSVYLTTKAKGRPNEIDVSESPTGSVILRYTLLEDPASILDFPPRITQLST